MNKGKFIILEGIDGCGKSTQIELLKQYISEKKINNYFFTEEPTNEYLGERIREIFTHNNGKIHPDLVNGAMNYLLAADRYIHLNHPVNGIIKHLNEGINVICSRYTLSTYVYQSNLFIPNKNNTFYQLNDDTIKLFELNKDFIEPDLILYLDCSLETSLKRISKRNVKDSNEKEQVLNKNIINYKNFIEAIDKGFLYSTCKVKTVNSEQPINKVFSDLLFEILLM